jgi:omega-amidase
MVDAPAQRRGFSLYGEDQSMTSRQKTEPPARSRTVRHGILRVRLLYDLPSVERLTARARTSDLLLLPELVDGGYASLLQGKGIHEEGDGTLESLRRASARLSSTLIAGSLVLRAPDGGRRNSSLVFQHGRCIHRYDKMHLFRPTGEERLFGAGKEAGVFTLKGRWGEVTSAVILCYDLRFPDLTRLLARAGARILFVPARWPRVRDAAWRTLLRARAMENQIFIIGCNGKGKEGGHSYAVDPLGVEIFSSRRRSGGEDVITCDLSRLEQARKHHDNLREALPLELAEGVVRVRQPSRGRG